MKKILLIITFVSAAVVANAQTTPQNVTIQKTNMVTPVVKPATLSSKEIKKVPVKKKTPARISPVKKETPVSNIVKK